jgi:hypothetical protein
MYFDTKNYLKHTRNHTVKQDVYSYDSNHYGLASLPSKNPRVKMSPHYNNSDIHGVGLSFRFLTNQLSSAWTVAFLFSLVIYQNFHFPVFQY